MLIGTHRMGRFSKCAVSLCYASVVLLLELFWNSSWGLVHTESLANLTIKADNPIARVGSTVRINCSVATVNQSNTASDIVWTHNATNLVGVWSRTLDAVSAQLNLDDVQIDDSGVYSCCLGKTAGTCDAITDSTSINIHIGLPPEPATSLKCRSNDFEHTNCTWVKGGLNSNLVTTDTLLRKQSSETWKSCTCINDAECNFKPTCSGTTCYVYCSELGMEATYRVCSDNQLGVNYSEEISFNTDVDTIPPPPYDVTVRNKSSSSLIVSWNQPQLHESTLQNLVKYSLKYRWEGDKRNWTTIKEIAGSLKTYTLDKLNKHPYGLYFVKMNSYPTFFKKSKSAFSATASGRTTEIAPIDVPGNFTCVNILNYNGKRNVILSWKPLPNKYKQNGEIRNYLITVHHIYSMVFDKWIVGPNETSYILKDMDREDAYNITIKARNSMGHSRNASFCSVKIVPVGFSSGLIAFVIVFCIGLILSLIVVACWRYLRTMRTFPELLLPLQLRNNNCYHLTHSPHRGLVREREVFDELLPCQLFVDLTSEKTPLESPGVACDVAFSDGFDLGDKPQGAMGFQQAVPKTGFQTELKDGWLLKSVPTDSNTDLPDQRNRHPSTETCSGSSLHSPISVGSGGSYFILQDVDKISYSHMTRDGLSPVKKNDIEGQKLRGEGASACSPTRSPRRNLGPEGDAEGMLSIFGEEPITSDITLGSSQQVLYKPMSPRMTGLYGEVDTPASSHSQTEETAGIFGLDQVVEEKEVDGLSVTNQELDEGAEGGVGSEQEDLDEDSLNGIETYVLSAGILPVSEGCTSPILDGFPVQNEIEEAIVSPRRAAAHLDDEINVPDSNGLTPSADALNESPVLAVCSETNANVNLPSADHLIYVGVLEDSGCVSPDSQGELSNGFTASTGSINECGGSLNYIAVGGDDESLDEEYEDAKEMSVNGLSGPDSSDATLQLSHTDDKRGSSGGGYIDQIQLDNISPLASPTRAGPNRCRQVGDEVSVPCSSNSGGGSVDADKKPGTHW